MEKLKSYTKSEYFRFDVAAALLGAALLIFLLATAKYGVSAPDEGYYYTVAHRLSLGEKMIADEWNLAQLVHLLNLLPNLLYIKLTGGTEGLILFMRYLFIAINTMFYGYIYVKLRPYKGWGVAAAFLFSAVIQQTLLTIAYFTAAPMAALAVCLILMIDRKEKRPAVLMLTGLIMACGILAEPFLIVLFLLWFALTAVRELRAAKGKAFMDAYGFLLHRRVFLWTTLGAVALFVPYMCYLIFSGSFAGVGAALPYLASGEEYNGGNLIDFTKIAGAAKLYGVPFAAGSAVCLVAAAVYRLMKRNSLIAKRAIFAAACIFLAGGYVYATVKTFGGKDFFTWVSFVQYNNFTLLLFAPVLWLLCDKKTPRFFLLWLTGTLFSVLVDISSTVILASGGGLIRVYCLLQLPALLPELREEPGAGKRKKSAPAPKTRGAALVNGALALCLAAAVLWNGAYVYTEGLRKPWEFLFSDERLEYRIERGPFKGLVTTAKIGKLYTDMLEDMDTIAAADTGRAPVCVAGLFPFTYLYADLPYGAYSAWYEYDEPARLAAYWQLRPARQPAYVYVPYYYHFSFARLPEETVREKLSALDAYIEGEKTEGRAGCIIRITKLIPPDDTDPG